MKMKEEQFRLIQAQIKRLMGQGGFYSKKFAGIDPDSIQSQEDFEKLPFTWKGDLRDAYPLGLQAVPDEQVVRIHSSSGTTVTPVIIPYTKKDVSDWAVSYTHLTYLGAVFIAACLRPITMALSTIFWIMSIISNVPACMDIMTMENDLHFSPKRFWKCCIISVSYTHLDVYKRQ